MPFGILETKHDGPVPGTVPLDEVAIQGGLVAEGMKLGKGSNSNIILEPQPSDDPNDPLTWSQTRKHIILLQLLLGVIIVPNVPIPMLNSGLVQMSIELHRPVSDMTKLTGYLLLASGSFGVFVSALAHKYGKRPLYVMGSILSLIGCIVGMTAKNYNTLVATRIIQGLGLPSYEALIFSSITDMYFVHERGTFVACVLFLQSGITNGVSILAGLIMEHLGWHYNYYILLPFVGVQTISAIFFLPETAYRRKHVQGASLNVPVTTETSQSVEEVADKPSENFTSTHVEISNTSGLRKTFWQEMALYNGTFSDSSILKMILACPTILTNVAASFSIIVSGFIIAWFVAISLLSSIMLGAPPYRLSTASVGYLSVGPLVGCLLGSIAYAAMADPLIKFMSRKNRGVYEPEFRIPIVFFGSLPTISGVAAFGYCLKTGQSMYILSFLWGFLLFGMTIVASAVSSYAVDAFSNYAVEIFIMNILFKNFLFYGVSTFIVEWYVKDGGGVFYTMAGISAGLCLTSVPMYMFGKRYRSFWARYDVIKMLQLDTRH